MHLMSFFLAIVYNCTCIVFVDLLLIEYIFQSYRSPYLLFSFLFADDTCIFIEGTNYDKVIYILSK